MLAVLVGERCGRGETRRRRLVKDLSSDGTNMGIFSQGASDP